jgi:hypothetical protein
MSIHNRAGISLVSIGSQASCLICAYILFGNFYIIIKFSLFL